MVLFIPLERLQDPLKGQLPGPGNHSAECTRKSRDVLFRTGVFRAQRIEIFSIFPGLCWAGLSCEQEGNG